jgi:hypothetical protein
MENSWVELPYWEEWGAITRIHGSAMVAFDHSMAFIEQNATVGMELVHGESGSEFRTHATDHFVRIQYGNDLHKMALIRYYSVLESFVRLSNFVITTRDFSILGRPLTIQEIDKIELAPLVGGIEAWSNLAMNSVKQDWSVVYGGRAGLTEVSLVRNAVAHGISHATKSLIDAAQSRSTSLPFADGQRLVISFELLNEYRGRLRSYCRALSDGLVHIAKGTHRSYPQI